MKTKKLAHVLPVTMVGKGRRPEPEMAKTRLKVIRYLDRSSRPDEFTARQVAKAVSQPRERVALALRWLRTQHKVLKVTSTRPAPESGRPDYVYSLVKNPTTSFRTAQRKRLKRQATPAS